MGAVPITRGVDLAREERMQVRDNVLEIFRHIFKMPVIVKYKDRDTQLSASFKRLYDELFQFLALSDKGDGGGREMEIA